MLLRSHEFAFFPFRLENGSRNEGKDTRSDGRPLAEEKIKIKKRTDSKGCPFFLEYYCTFVALKIETIYMEEGSSRNQIFILT